MSDIIFDSYINSIYGSGSSIEYFDSGIEQDITGGMNIKEFINNNLKKEDIDTKSVSSDEYNKDDTKSVSSDEDDKDDVKSVSSDEDDKDDTKSVSSDEDDKNDTKSISSDEDDNLKKEESIVGYMEIKGIHLIPIIEELKDEISLITPMKININDNCKITPEDINITLSKLT